MKKNDRIVHYMKKVASSSPYPSFKIGAVIFYKKKVVSVGFNQEKTHPYVKENGPSYSNSVHAELDAIFKAQRKNPELLKGATIVVYREGSSGEMRSSRPCPMCMEKIKSVGIKTIVYSTNQGMVTEHVKNVKEEYSENYETFYPQCIRNKAV